MSLFYFARQLPVGFQLDSLAKTPAGIMLGLSAWLPVCKQNLPDSGWYFCPILPYFAGMIPALLCQPDSGRKCVYFTSQIQACKMYALPARVWLA